MTARATWKGILQISQVAIPIKVFPATESSESLAFNQLHASCQSRIQQKKWCPICAREVPSAEIVKGFEFEKGRYVLLDAAELDAVQPPSTRVIELTQFANVAELEPTAIDRSYFLAPDGAAAGEAYAIVSQAMRGLVGIGKLAIYGREYLVAVRPPPMRASLVAPLLLHTLHHDAEMRSTVDLELPGVTAPATDESRLASRMIRALRGPLNLADFTDAYQVDVRRLIDAKIAGQEIIEPVPIDTPPQLPLLEALTQSLAAVTVSIDTKAKRKHRVG